MTRFICWLDDAESVDTALVGGKAANLGILSQAGFRVPTGFTVTTAAYSEFITGPEADKVLAQLDGIDYDDLPKLEAVTSDIREFLAASNWSRSLTDQIMEAYDRLGPQSFVAVRSSATTEDLAEASFAGLHDTFLDIKGAAAVVDAIKCCWGSLWSVRATAYRQRHGFDHRQAHIAVIVQAMVEPTASGVMFTGNPLTAATNEIVINASWGLGEGIVQGVVAPDEFVVKMGTLAIRERQLGEKRHRVIRDRATGSGTVVEATLAEDQARFSLTNDEVAELADLGRQVLAHYRNVPQDIEWALENGTIHLLQSRPITGVEFSWDADLDDWQDVPEPDDALWSRTMADHVWTGAVTPLFYSYRSTVFASMFEELARRLGIAEIAQHRVTKFYKSEVYFNPQVEMAYQKRTWIPALRSPQGGGLWWLPPTWHAELLSAPFDYRAFIRLQARLLAAAPQNGVLAWLKLMDQYIATPEWGLDHLPNPRHLSDRELKRTIDKYIRFEKDYNDDVLVPFLMWTRDSLALLELIVTKWYDGENAMAYGELLTGATRRTKTIEENLALYALANEIRGSEYLREALVSAAGAEFFTVLEGTEEGNAFLSRYHEFVEEHGHRGHEDRDLFYPRRYEDPSIDYASLCTLVNSSEAEDPEAREEETNRRREQVFDDVYQNLHRKPLGFLKAEAFKAVYDYVHRWIVIRDDERWSYERYALGLKLLFAEMERRLMERGLLAEEKDCYFLAKNELFELFDGHANEDFAHRKIAARKKNFNRVLNREWSPPVYIRNNLEVSLESDSASGLRGIGTSPGTVKATARVVKRLSEVVRVNSGEILVCNATDPGWTPVFQIISGIVTETGSMLAHASCLSREYGLPCVTQLADAMALIPDGATITVNGATGEVVVEDLGECPPAEHTVAVA